MKLTSIKLIRKLAVGCLSLSLLFTFALGCGSENAGGGSGSGNTLIVTPAETTVNKGATEQFSVSSTETATWSVDGGDENGTIDDTGLYTPPAQLPIDPSITVRVSTSEGEGTATVNLRTGDNLTFNASEQVNDAGIPSGMTLAEFILAGVSDRLSVQLGSIHVNSIWVGQNAGDLVALSDQSVDFLGFGLDLEIAGNAAQNFGPTSIVTNSQLNPGVVIASDPSGDFRLSYLASEDQGNSFLAPVELDPSDPGDTQYQANAKLDAQDSVHVVYLHESSALGTGSKIRYVRSNDHGATWTAGKQVSATASAQTFPQVAVSDDGQTIYICYSDNQGGVNDIYVAKSADGGASFAAPVAVSASGTAGLCRIALGLQGEIYVSYMDSSDVMFSKSVNGGNSFSAALKVNSDATNNTIPFPFMAVDSLGRIDLVWSADPDIDGDLDAVMHARSTDEGASFSANLPLDDGAGENVVLPLGLTHDLSGRLHVQYLSDKNNPATAYDIFYQRAE